mmetsp:Transcript_5538/g.20046  ORF Transcript_5538/g.20046 Transcript_5538/m.20046 type:complete len:278 (-) Transcript_5538:36-869(-)
MDGGCQRQRRRRGVRSGGGRDARRASAHVEDGDGGRVRLSRRDEVARPEPHTDVSAIRGLQEGRPGVVSAHAAVFDLSAVHVQPSSVAVRAGVQQLAGRDGVLPHDIVARERSELFGDDPADADGVLVQRAPGAGAAGRVLHHAGSHPRLGRVFLHRRLSRADDRAVEEGELPGPGGTRRVQAAPRGAEGGRERRVKAAVPDAAVGGLRPARIAGALFAREIEPVGDVQQRRRGRRRRGGHHLHGRRLVAGVHGSPETARGRQGLRRTWFVPYSSST